MARLTQTKMPASVTSRPPVDQRVGRKPSRPWVPNRSWYHSWPLIARTTAKTMANSWPIANQDPPEHGHHGKGQEPAPGKPPAFSRKELKPHRHHDDVERGEPVPVVLECFWICLPK